jgi:hypothetical protein
MLIFTHLPQLESKFVEDSHLMKKFIWKSKVALSLAVVALSITASALARTGKQDFVLRNQTGVEIHELYVSPVDVDDWQEDVLGQDTLPSGESVKITFDDREKKGKWDLKVVDNKGNSLEWHDLNLVEINAVTLHWDANKGKGWADIK